MSRATNRARWELELGVVDVPNLADHSFQPSEYSGYLCQFCQRSSWSHGQRTLGGWTPQLTFREHTGDKDWPSCVGATAYAAGIAWAKHVRAIKPFVYVPPKPYKFVPPSKQTIPGAAEFKRAYKAHLAANGPLVCPVEDWARERVDHAQAEQVAGLRDAPTRTPAALDQ